MSRTTRKQRLVMLGLTTALAAGGALLPSGAFAAPATPHAGATTATVEGKVAKSDPKGNNKGHHNNGKKGKKGKKGTRAHDIENMPGCKFVSGKVYCEHKPDKPLPTDPKPIDPAPNPAPNPAPAPPAPAPAPPAPKPGGPTGK